MHLDRQNRKTKEEEKEDKDTRLIFFFCLLLDFHVICDPFPIRSRASGSALFPKHWTLPPSCELKFFVCLLKTNLFKGTSHISFVQLHPFITKSIFAYSSNRIAWLCPFFLQHKPLIGSSNRKHWIVHLFRLLLIAIFNFALLLLNLRSRWSFFANLLLLLILFLFLLLLFLFRHLSCLAHFQLFSSYGLPRSSLFTHSKSYLPTFHFV